MKFPEVSTPVSEKFTDYIHLFFQLNVWLCLLSAVMVVATATALSIPLSDTFPAVVMPPLLFYFLYLEDRRRITTDDRINHPHRSHLIKKYNTGIVITELAALISYEALIAAHIPADVTTIPVSIGMFLLGQTPIAIIVIYDSLKASHVALDSATVALTWVFAIIYPLVITTDHVFHQPTLLVSLGWFLIVFAGVESRNIKDIEGDRKAGKPTIATKLGPKYTSGLVFTFKITGVLIFWEVAADILAPLLVVGHLAALRLFRALTARTTADKRHIDSADTPQSIARCGK